MAPDVRNPASFVGQVLELGSSLQISKLAWGLVLGLLALMGPILKFERPTPGRSKTLLNIVLG